MVSINWCLKQKNGLELVTANKNMSESYLSMAEESVKVLSNVSESDIWTATMSYYIYYYSLYALMQRIGVKCEIHSCSIEFMNEYLKEFYDAEDIKEFELAFIARIDLQYYSNRSVDKAIIENSRKNCKLFYVKTKDILSKLREEQIQKIRKALKA
ncbi:MAG: hypothetical protein WC758_01790 [Candidatus Woesearchaeota archaeon]|jgi:uncharacterized protein (UPF0332 family)